MLSPLRLASLMVKALVASSACMLMTTTPSAHALPRASPRKPSTTGALRESPPLDLDANIPNFWMPQSNFIMTENIKPASSPSVDIENATQKSFTWIQNQWSLTAEDYKLASSLQASDTGVSQISVVQMVDGLPIANAVANVNVDGAGQVISGSGSICPKELVAKAKAAAASSGVSGRLSKRAPNDISAADAVKAFAKAKGLNVGVEALDVRPVKDDPNAFQIRGADFARRAIPASLKYYQTPQGTLEKAWDLQIELADDWVNAFISTTTGQVLGVSSWVSQNLFDNDDIPELLTQNKPTTPSSDEPSYSTNSDDISYILNDDDATNSLATHPLNRRQAPPPARASYNVIPFGFSDPIDNGGRLTTLTNPADPLASRNGWHDFGLGAGSVSATQGNNIIASSNPQNARNALQNPRVAVQNFNFNFNLNPNVAATPNSQNSAAGVTNMFYVTNTFHDVLFHYGFDEPAGNFQVSNFGRGGRGNDPVIATAQDGSGVNNANFASPPDGTPGRMRMFLFTAANPDRDAALENDIIIHEIGHGVSTRLTGGPANSNCLRSSQSSGMGEGWSDFFGVLTQMKQEDTRNTDVGVGVFVTQRAAGVRRNPYSTSLQRNPSTYATLRTTNPRNPHAIGEVWNSMLYEVYWNMVDKEGFAPPSTLIAQRNSNRGNVNMMKLIIDSLKLQPCNPTLIQSRNAIVQADQVRFGGSHRCEIFRGFAKRGLGVNARDDGAFVNNFDVPQGC